MKQTMKEINEALGKNVRLLSFSMDHVRSSIENVVGFINNVTYGKSRKEYLSSPPERSE